MCFFVYVFVVLLNPSGCSMEKDAGAAGTDAGRPRMLEGHPRKRERESGLDPASNQACGEKCVGLWGRAEEGLRPQPAEWTGKQEEVSLVAFCSAGTRFLSS